MKPTRAPEISVSTPSSIPSPARRIGQTATFLPEMRGTGATSSGVSISTSSVGRSFVASYVRSSVTSSTSLRKCTVGVFRSRRYDTLCWTSGCMTWMTGTTGLRDVRGVPAEAGVQRPPLAQRLGAGPQPFNLGVGLERVDDDRCHLPEVVCVEASHRDGGRADPDAGGDHRRPLVERHRVAVRGQLALLHPLLRCEPGPVGRAQVELHE